MSTLYNNVSVNPYHRALEAEDADEGFFDSVVDFGKYGISSSIVSGTLGLVNTGVAFTNMFGAEIEKFETEEVLGSMGWKDTQAYYDDNRDFIDAVGFVASSFVPGALGLKAAKAAQVGLASSKSTHRAVVGLRKALVPEKKADILRKQIAKDSTIAKSRSGQIADAAKEGFHQAAVEGVFAETAILAMNNQNPSINQEDLSYFDSIMTNAGGAAFGLALGTGIGGVVYSAINYRTLHKLTVTKELEETMEFDFGQFDSQSVRSNVIQGDRINDLFEKYQINQDKIGKMKDGTISTDESTLLQGERRQTAMRDEIVNEIARLTDELSGDDIVKNNLTASLFQTLEKMAPEDRQNVLAGLQRAGTFNDLDIAFDPISPPTQILDDDQWVDVVQKRVYGDQYDPNSQIQKDYIANNYEDTMGITFQGKDGIQESVVAVRDKIFQEGTKDEALKILRHEVGHAHTYSARRIKELLETPAAADIHQQLKVLSKLNRPQAWQAQEQYLQKQRELTQKLTTDSSPEDMEQVANLAEALERVKIRLESPDELLADAWAVLSNPKMRQNGIKQAPDVERLFRNNHKLKQRLGLSEVLADLRTGKMYDIADRVPTIRDRGKVKFDSRFKQVKWEGGSANIHNQFDAMKASPEEASAHYFAAYKEAKAGMNMPKAINVKWSNFYQLNKILHRLDTDKPYEGVITVEMDNGIKKVLTMVGDETSSENFRKFYKAVKQQATTGLRLSPDNKFTDADIARVVDVDEDFAFSSGYGDGEAFWSQVYNPEDPTVTKLFYKNRTELLDPVNAETIADSRLRIKEAQMSAIASFNDFAHSLDESLADMFPKSTVETGLNYTKSITRMDEGAGLLSSNQGEYGQGKSMIQQIAQAGSKMLQRANEKMEIDMASPTIALKNTTEALHEAAVLDAKLRQKFYAFVPNVPEGELESMLQNRITFSDTAKAQDNIRKLLATNAGKQLAKAMTNTNNIWTVDVMDTIDDIINSGRFMGTKVNKLESMLETEVSQIHNPVLANYWKSRVKANSQVVKAKRLIAAIRGLDTNIRDDVLYPGSLDRARYKYVQFVTPTKRGIFGDNKPGIIGAPDEATLQKRVQEVKEKFGDSVVVRTKAEQEAYFKQIGELDKDLRLNEWQTNDFLQRKGVLWDVAPEPSPQLIDHYNLDMRNQLRNSIDNLITARYGEEFGVLEAQAKQWDTLRSTLGNIKDKKNPFRSQANIALNRADDEQFGAWKSGQEKLDNVLSSLFNTIRHAFPAAKSTGDYEKLNKYLDDYNLPRIYNDRVGQFLVETEGLDQQLVKNVMPMANGAAATMMLRLDYVQPMINALSLPITSVPELKHLLDSVPDLQRQQATMGTRVMMPSTIPGEPAKYSMYNSLKLMQQAMKDFWKMKDLAKDYYNKGYSSGIVREMRDAADAIALDPKFLKEHGIKGYQSRIDKVVDFLAKPADFSEEFVKFTAARMADLTLTNAGITNSTIKNMAINTFVKRVHANYTYAQRPAIFQGIVGQAVGLFQTYQFNLYQQLLRHVGDKQFAAVGAMAGIQMGMFGAQSVPGFRAMNNHIGERSLEGNDFYTASNELLGEDLSEWILYGAASNFIKPVYGDGLQLYTRGDLNPHQPFVIPTSIDEIPVYSMATRFLGSVFTAADSIAEGVPAGQVMAEALATNGVNRPLAGLGQILGGASTTSQGTLVSATQDLDWIQKLARLAGTKTLDESIAVQSFYRAKGYETWRRDKINGLGQRVKKTVRAGDWNAENYNKFIKDYTKFGGKIDYFNRWVHDQSMSATESTIYDMYSENNSAEGRYLQKLMGANIERYVGIQYE